MEISKIDLNMAQYSKSVAPRVWYCVNLNHGFRMSNRSVSVWVQTNLDKTTILHTVTTLPKRHCNISTVISQRQLIADLKTKDMSLSYRSASYFIFISSTLSCNFGMLGYLWGPLSILPGIVHMKIRWPYSQESSCLRSFLWRLLGHIARNLPT